jgi:hypothetical protein
MRVPTVRADVRGRTRLTRWLSVALAAAFVPGALSSCGDEPRADSTRSDSASTGAAPAADPRTPTRPGIRFDPRTLTAGTRVGTLVADSVDASMTPADSTYVGIARFRGEIELSGRTFRHPDADLGGVASCFEADSASAATLPRWAGDERRPWFCFVNRADAKGALGPPGNEREATIVIDGFTIHRGLSDQVNEARLVHVVRVESPSP